MTQLKKVTTYSYCSRYHSQQYTWPTSTVSTTLELFKSQVCDFSVSGQEKNTQTEKPLYQVSCKGKEVTDEIKISN